MRLTGLFVVGVMAAVTPIVVLTAAAPPTIQPSYVGPPGRNDLADRQMVDFVFDLRTLPGDDLTRAVTTASIYVDQMWTRADAGVNVFHVAAVHVLASTAETVQDFTWNKSAIQQALASVSSRPGLAASTGERRLRNMTSICESLSQHGSTEKLFEGSNIPPASLRLVDGKAVLYFGNGVFRNMDAPPDVADLSRACTKSNVWFFSINGATFFDPMPPLGNPIGVSLEVLQHQVGSPLSLVGLKSTLDYGFAAVTVQNDTLRSIKSFTLAALVRPNDATLGTPQIFRSQFPGPAIRPSGAMMVSTRLIDGATLSSLAIKGAKAQLGLVDVEFDDGRHWTYDLQAKGEFQTGSQQTDWRGTALPFAVYTPEIVARAVQSGRVDILSGVIVAADVPDDDPFAAGAHRLREPALQPPKPDQPFILGTDRTKPARLVEVDAIVDATGRVLRVRTARSVDDSPGGIDQRALVLVRDATFTPAHFLPTRFNGDAVPVLIRVPVLVYY
jgi:hypothetical protein